MALYADIELTTEEIAKALQDAKANKARVLEFEERQAQSRQRAKELTEPFDVRGLLNFCIRFYTERFNKSFFLSSELIGPFAEYFTNDPDFEKRGYSLNKGILIMGNVGVGKTELMKFFQKNKKQCYKVISCNEVADDYSHFKNDIAEVYSTPIQKAMNDADVFFQREIGYCFDDLGTEEIKNDYGNKKNVMADILMAIYNKKQFSKFFITTNLNSEEIIERYGSRINSRLREMFNVFVLEGNDMRK